VEVLLLVAALVLVGLFQIGAVVLFAVTLADFLNGSEQ